ncbi:MAG: hypothetical protein ABSA90_00900 [Xanthobacteraceae bacterium]
MVEVSEIIVDEGDEPDVVADLFDADVLTGEYGTEIDFLPIEADLGHAQATWRLPRVNDLRRQPVTPAASATAAEQKQFRHF